jgi:hypothetical protein
MQSLGFLCALLLCNLRPRLRGSRQRGQKNSQD